jgi:5-methylcytosine-specific restriction endonuclease McrA
MVLLKVLPYVLSVFLICMAVTDAHVHVCCFMQGSRRRHKGKHKASADSDEPPWDSSDTDDDSGDGGEVDTQSKQFPREATFRELQGELGLDPTDTILCLWCFKPVELEGDCVIDHLCPKRNGGPKILTNAAALHRSCNMWKGVGHIISGPGIRALATLVRQRDTIPAVEAFMQLLDSEIKALRVTMKRGIPKGSKHGGTS